MLAKGKTGYTSEQNVCFLRGFHSGEKKKGQKQNMKMMTVTDDDKKEDVEERRLSTTIY